MRTLRLVLPAAVLLGACSSATSTAPSARAPESIPNFESVGSEVDLRITPSTSRNIQGVRAPLDQVWASLPEIYRSLGIEPNTIDEATRTVGTARVTAAQVGGKRVSAYLRCAHDGSGLSSVSGRLYRMTVMTSLAPEGTGTSVTTRVEGTATPVDGSSGGTSYCASTGELEQRIATLIREGAGR